MSTAIQWMVLPALASDVMIVTGVTDKPSVARSAVEETMTASPDAEWGEVVRIAVTGWPARGVELSEWPPQGVVYVCRRTTNEGEYEWMPCFPLYEPSLAG